MRKQHAILLAAVGLTACLAILGGTAGWYLANRDSSDPGGTDPTPSESGQSDGDSRTYDLDRTLHYANSTRVTLIRAETADGKLTLHVRYRNESSEPWPLACPTVEDDQTAAQVTLPDGQAVHAETTWCATTKPGESFEVAPGEDLLTWAVFSVVPESGQPFQVGWYDFPVLDGVRLG